MPHTPGPWRAGHIDHGERGEKIAVRAEEIDNQPYIAFLPDLLGNVMDDATLIAAAPGLLAACEKLVSLWDEFMADEGCMNPLDYPISERLAEMRAAIAAARGK